MPRVLNFGAFRQQPLPAALTPPRQCGPSALCFHARAKTVLAFARAL
jgi:hypothetical protein